MALGRPNNAGTIRAGVVTAVEVERPSPPNSNLSLVDGDSPTTWGVIVFVAAVLMLFLVL